MLSPGTRVGPYEIVSWLGAGGMGEVYRARDVNLAREVALKILPAELASQPDRLARLKQEARILASLNHPGIATLHGLEEVNGGVPVLVMELVGGESLADRLRRGPLTLREAMAVAHQIALALEAAHEKGVLHRDLKPGNIRTALDGRVKLLDFGLARVVRDVAFDSQLATKTAPSSPGSVEGTAPYMSPEQARGQEVDRRSDVWAFGCVLFELLTGKRAFGGATYSDTVAAILEHEPDRQALPPGTPAAVLKLLRRCLQKEKDERLRDIGDARLEIEDILAAPASTGDVVLRPGRRALWLVMAAVAALLVVIGSWVIQRSPSVPREVVRLSLEGPEEGDMGSPILSPTGERVVYRTSSGLVVRELYKAEGRAIPGTGAAIRPFFSPDGKWIAYNDTADHTLKRVSLTGGVPVRVCGSVWLSYGATWGPDGTIVVAVDSFSGLWQVPAAGGEPRELTKPDRAQGEKTHRNPHYLPGGKAVLFTVGTSRLASWDDAKIEVLELAGGSRRTLIEGGTAPAYVESGHLVYLRGSSILAVPFDLGRLAVTGTPMAVVEGVQSQSLTYGAPTFTVARTGTLVYWPHQGTAQRLVVVDRAGRARPLSPFVEGPLVEPRLSPDGRAIALRRSGANDQVWRFDIERESFSQVTFEWDNITPVWTPDGASLIVTSSPGWKLHRVRADGSGTAERLAIAGVAVSFPAPFRRGFWPTGR